MSGESYPTRADLLKAFERLAAAQDRERSYRGDNVYMRRRLEADSRAARERVERLRDAIRRRDFAEALACRARRSE